VEGGNVLEDQPTTPRASDTGGGANLAERVEEIEAVAPGVAPIVDAAIRNPGAEPAAVLDGIEDPLVVVMEQRAAMARAIELREDESLDPSERERWAAVVVRLAAARHEAKEALAERRRNDPSEETWMDAEFQAQVLSRDDDHDASDVEARGAPAAPGDHSGRDEPAAWQEPNERIGPETGLGTAPSSPRRTDQLTSGPGLAGGTGGAGSQNLPADTGARPSMPPLSPDEDVEPPDVGHR
jgi:hypothetical protein